MQTIKFRRVSKLATIPKQANPSDAGADVSSIENVVIQPGERMIIKTGLIVEMPVGLELQVRPRSGLAIKNGLTVLNSPGTIDSGYRGEIMIILINHGKFPCDIAVGDRIAQLVASVVPAVNFVETIEELSASDRGDKGFGSSGVKSS